jgi:hypothetical protein
VRGVRQRLWHTTDDSFNAKGVLHLAHSSGVQTEFLVSERSGTVSEDRSLVPTRSRDIVLTFPLVSLSLSGRLNHRAESVFFVPSVP